MKFIVKKKWINALTNGKYVQLCGYLREPVESESEIQESNTEYGTPDLKSNKMCVLGVLADLAFRDSGLKLTERNWRKFALDNKLPTNRTLTWAGLSSSEAHNLVEENDGSNISFSELADIIEKEEFST